MKRITTQEDLIRLLYQETGSDEQQIIQDSIKSNPALKEEYENLQETKKCMDNLFMRPSQNSLDKVLEYLKA